MYTKDQTLKILSWGSRSGLSQKFHCFSPEPWTYSIALLRSSLWNRLWRGIGPVGGKRGYFVHLRECSFPSGLKSVLWFLVTNTYKPRSGSVIAWCQNSQHVIEIRQTYIEIIQTFKALQCNMTFWIHSKFQSARSFIHCWFSMFVQAKLFHDIMRTLPNL